MRDFTNGLRKISLNRVTSTSFETSWQNTDYISNLEGDIERRASLPQIKEGETIARIIVADENQGRRDLLANTFQREGFDVTRTPTLRQTEATAIATFPDVILLESEWSQGSVLDVCQKMNSNPKFRNSTRIVVLSRSITPDFLSSAAMAGVAEVIGKPIDMNQLISQMQRHASKQFVAPPAEIAPTQGGGLGGQRFDVSMTMNDSQWALPMLRRLVEAGNIDDDFVRDIQVEMGVVEEEPLLSSEDLTTMVRLALNRLVGTEGLQEQSSKEAVKGPSFRSVSKGASLSAGAKPKLSSEGGLGGSMEDILDKQAREIAAQVEEKMDGILDEEPEFISLLTQDSQSYIDPEALVMTQLTTELVHDLLKLLKRPGAVSDITLLTQIEDALTLTGDVLEALPAREEEE
jgi:DNA-binding response OmpR family regulator